MATGRSVVINGDLGSGKSTVSVLLAQRLGIRRVSVGDVYRDMAVRRGMSALDLNLHAELDDKIDHYVDQLQSDIATSGDVVVVDSRLAWFFFHDALKVHLVTDPDVAAHRVLARPADATEGYTSVAEARQRLAERSESERLRFITRYGADKTRLRNYDMVCDSTRAMPEEIVTRIVDGLGAPAGAGPRLFVDPGRVRIGEPGPDSPTHPVEVRYVRGDFVLVAGRAALRAAVDRGEPLVVAALAEPVDEPSG